MNSDHSEFVLWILTELGNKSKDNNDYNDLTSIVHVMCRISTDLLNKINMDDPEAAYIIDALDYVYSSEYKNSTKNLEQ